MQQHVFLVKRSKIILQSYFIRGITFLQIGIDVSVLVRPYRLDSYNVFIIANAIFLILNFCSIYLFLSYYKYSAHKQFIITDNSVQLLSTDSCEIINMTDDEIASVKCIRSFETLKVPWRHLGYFCFTDIHNNKIIVTSFLINTEGFWLYLTAKRTYGTKLTKREKLFPIIKN